MLAKIKKSSETMSHCICEKLSIEELAARMVPYFGFGCCRMTPGEECLQRLRKPNVQVIRDSVVRFTKTGIFDETGIEHRVDAVVCATGFADPFKLHFKVVGRGDKIMHDELDNQPVAYMSIIGERLPNLFCEYRCPICTSPPYQLG